MRKAFTENEYEIVYSMAILAKRSGATTAEAIGRSPSMVNFVSRWIRLAQAQEWDEIYAMYRKNLVRKDAIEAWAKKRLNIVVPAEPEPAEEPEPPATAVPSSAGGPVQTGQAVSNDDKFLLKLITEQAAQTALLRAMLETIKGMAPSVISDMQMLRASHKRMAESVDKMEAAILKLDDALHDTGKCLSADLKDNINANADVLRQELNTIKNNTRKRGL